jgi:hypothetical protein
VNRQQRRRKSKGINEAALQRTDSYRARQAMEVDNKVNEIMGKYCEALLVLGVDETTIVAAATMIGGKDTREYIANAELPKLGEAPLTVGLTVPSDDATEG